jgi:hypothetical protein
MIDQWMYRCINERKRELKTKFKVQFAKLNPQGGISEAFVVLSFPDLIGESTLRQAQGDVCHGELVRPGESAEEDRTMDYPVKPDNDSYCDRDR